MSAPLIDRQQIATRHGLSYRYVRDTLTKRPDFPAPAQRLSQRRIRNSSKIDSLQDFSGIAAGMRHHPAPAEPPRSLHFCWPHTGQTPAGAPGQQQAPA